MDKLDEVEIKTRLIHHTIPQVINSLYTKFQLLKTHTTKMDMDHYIDKLICLRTQLQYCATASEQTKIQTELLNVIRELKNNIVVEQVVSKLNTKVF